MPCHGASIFFDAGAEPLAREIAHGLPAGFTVAPGDVPDSGWYLFAGRDGLLLRKGDGRFRLSDGVRDRRRRQMADLPDEE